MAYILLNLVKLKISGAHSQLLKFSRFHCNDELIHWLTLSRFILFIDAFFVIICSPSFERVHDLLTQSCMHHVLFWCILLDQRDGNIFFLLILSGHILHQKNMKKWSSMTK